MFISYHISIKLFKNISYFFFILLGFLMNLTLGYIIVIIYGKNNLTKFYNLIIHFGTGIILSIIGIYNERNIRFDKCTIYTNNLKGKLTICHVSDMHLGIVYGKSFVKKLVNKLKEEKYDILVITGDICEGNLGKIKMKEDMLEPLKEIKVPKYYVTGNHEYFSDINETLNMIKNIGIKHLSNESIIFNNQINLIGIDYENPFKNQRKKLMEIIDKNSPLINICICHVPLFKPKDLIPYNIFLFLCGHTHGAQMIPTNIYIYLKSRVFNGLYNYLNKYYVYCASGVGTSEPPMRVVSRANIGLINIIGYN
jgi:predicted MPP superfamily phosphohydrolase